MFFFRGQAVERRRDGPRGGKTGGASEPGQGHLPFLHRAAGGIRGGGGQTVPHDGQEPASRQGDKTLRLVRISENNLKYLCRLVRFLLLSIVGAGFGRRFSMSILGVDSVVDFRADFECRFWCRFWLAILVGDFGCRYYVCDVAL